MAKSVNDLVLDAALDFISTNCDKMTACSAEPTTYAEGNATFALADVAMAGGDFTKANGDVSGRKLTIGAKSGVLIDANGTANHVALLDTVNSRLLLVTTATNLSLVAGQQVNFGAWDFEISDPA